MDLTIEDDGSGLAAALRDIERRVLEESPDRVLVADASDAALAAALVATKLGVPLAATDVATAAPTTNGRLIAQLAASYTQPA